MNYKRLGDYIQPVNIRNKELEVTNLLGVSIKKVLMPSIANTIGTNMKTYKIIKQNQFAYGPVTSRNGDKISIALLENFEKAIVSQAYTVFKVIDEQEVLPEYLMMWFRRPEFDRYARYKSHGSAREVFDWEELCDTQLPIPSLEKQQQLVDEYNTVTNRIKLNEQLNQKLEETAQALYKHWFVDFEFPNADGKPYKSSGGEMIYNEELDKDIPVEWSVESIGNVVDNLGGGTPKTEAVEFWNNGTINWFSPTDITNSNYIFCNNSNRKITKLGLDKSSAKLFPKNSLMMTSRATIGKLGINTTEACTNQGFITLIPNESYQLFSLVEWLKSNLDEVEQLSSGSTFKEISKSEFRNLKIFKTENFDKLEINLIPIYKKINDISEQSQTLQELQSLLLAKMTKVETEIAIV